MIIFGTRGITSIQRQGTFHCPACGAGAPFQEKGIRRFFTLFFIPLIPLDKVNEHVECGRCGCTFKPEVLTWIGGLPAGTAAGAPPPLPGAGGPPAPMFARHMQATGTTVSYQGNGMAKASMILGIIGLVTSFLICPSVFLSILGLVFGIIGLNRVKQGGGLVGGKGQAKAGIICSSLGLIALVVIFASVANDRKNGIDSRSPRERVTQSLSGTSADAAHGNTPEAKLIARKYADVMDELHAAAIDSGSHSSRKPRHIVHCELHDGTCALLAVVPDYRKFTDEAKAGFEEIAWKAANRTLKNEPAIKTDAELCVGLKGLVMFGSVMTGRVGQDTPDHTSKKEEEMDRFFLTADKPAGNPEKETH